MPPTGRGALTGLGRYARLFGEVTYLFGRSDVFVVIDQNRIARLGKLQADCSADAARSARHQCHLVLDHSGLSPPSACQIRRGHYTDPARRGHVGFYGHAVSERDCEIPRAAQRAEYQVGRAAPHAGARRASKVFAFTMGAVETEICLLGS